MSDLRVIFAGSGAFGMPTAAALKKQIVQVVTQPDRPAGRGQKLLPTAAAVFAMKENVPLLRTEDINRETLPDADVMVVIAFGQKISPLLVNRPRLGSVNLHASLLPKFRGAAPIVWSMLSSNRVTGNSVIRLAERMDAGAILAQSRVEIRETETAGELHDRLAMDGAGLMAKVLEDLAAGKASERPQDEAQASGAPKLSRRDAVLDWEAGAETAALRIRALWPWPSCHVRLMDAAKNEVARLSLIRAKAVESEGSRWQSGEIEGTGHIRAGDGAVEILEVRPDGGRPMALADYRRGHAWMAGMRVESASG
jgi:methionyl-tRNA formyltransferase